AKQLQNGDPFAGIAIPIRASRQATVSIISKEDAILSLTGVLARANAIRDVASNGKPGPVAMRPMNVQTAHHGIGFSALRYIGKMHAADISRLEIGVLDEIASNSIRYAKKIILRITDPSGFSSAPITDMQEPFRVSASTFKTRLAASTANSAGLKKQMSVQSDSDVVQLPGIQSDDGKVYRMYIRQSGIFHITFADCKNFGIDPSKIDPTTLRIINKGQQVPVYVFDHQDGHFDPNDYFEFYGEEEHYQGPGTYGDFYYDPDTKDNIYYLVWGSHNAPIPAGGIKRIVEESGEIREADKSKYIDLKDSSFFTKLHIEQDLQFDDLDISDLDQRSDLRDHVFMAILSTGGQGYTQNYSMQTVVPFPDVRNNRPVSIRVALHGISHFDPGSTDAKGIELPNVPNEDDAWVSINGKDVLHGTWDSQVMKFLSTDTASQLASAIPSAELLGVNPADSSGGIPPVTINFAQRKQTDVSGCRFGVNWIEIGYDRMYYAYQDAITFHAPAGSGNGLYQFTLQNFSRTDISIYRKGVSIISNVVITSNPNQLRSTKAIFQLDVASSADEFIAVVDSNKLKPYRYAVDDFAGLHANNNSGEYLIITNRDHLVKGNPKLQRVPLQDLLDYRTANNHITGKIVDVANIYDEFHYGSRSPNAIKAFLDYAYHNWQDPPKYVLLVGVTHYGTDDPQAYTPPDQVPAPYIQAYLEGPVTGDVWYGMVDGDDLIPDLIVGRIATTTIADDAAYIAKLKEFEADRSSPGAWKNLALFIGAGGAFDSDIDGLLLRSLPSRVSVLRQSIKRNSPYFGTDQTLVDNVNAGLGYIAYFGHGGNAIWDDPLDSVGRPVLANFDIPRFHNQGHYPVIMSMTCFTAGFDGDLGILNGFINTPNAGSVACFGTTSFGWEQNDEHMAMAILPYLYDSVGGSIAERMLDGKIQFLLETNPGDLIPPTLMYGYHFLGDPLAAPLVPSDHVSLTLGSRLLQPGGTEQLTGTTTIATGHATIGLVNELHSPLAPPHVIANVPITNGTFSIADNIPSGGLAYGSYRVTASDATDSRYAATSEDVTITTSRMSELDFEPRPLPVNSSLDFSAAVQSPQSITSVVANFNIYSQNAGGTVTERTIEQPMSLNADRYHATLSSSQLNGGDKVIGSVTLTTSSEILTSDSATIIVGAASDPAAFKDFNHRALSGKYASTKNGLVWNEAVYNWGASQLNSITASLLDAHSGVLQIVGSQAITGLAPHGTTLVTIPVQAATMDSAIYMLAVSPDAGTSPLNLRDSTIANDTTTPLAMPRGAIAYQRSIGTTLDGINYDAVPLSGGEVVMGLPASAEGNIASDVIRLDRRYDALQTGQPDIHFIRLLTDKSRPYSSIRIVSDSLGAIPLSVAGMLTLSLDTADTTYKAHIKDSLYIYRQDDRTKLWTILATTRPSPDKVTATITNLGTFAAAYNTDRIPPIVDMTVEGQVFSNNGEVPPQPHIHAVIQDADGIDVTPGKTVVRIDNRQLAQNEFVILDSGRTTTTINLRMEPSLTDGNHKITIQSTDNDGRTNAPPKELDVHVSNEFSIGLLGSYPNPFTKDYMFIAYEIRGIAFAESVSLDIFTVSGRRIRTLNYPSDDPTRTFGFLKGGTGVPTSLGYHEVWWDGRDDGGNEVANGAYFYRLEVNTNGANRQLTGKFARLR
ncbi:MAG TPA: C25 family cysteine peptidase, partial [Candidatus Kapabacteria bacterium]|nr:C25 family cysteine peptidase [Candidatus Kapabacteria bacterium]